MKTFDFSFLARTFLLTLACGAAITSRPASAQSDQNENFSGLEEVIVTATKRAETLQEVGMSITALSNAEL